MIDGFLNIAEGLRVISEQLRQFQGQALGYLHTFFRLGFRNPAFVSGNEP